LLHGVADRHKQINVTRTATLQHRGRVIKLQQGHFGVDLFKTFAFQRTTVSREFAAKVKHGYPGTGAKHGTPPCQ